MAESQVPTGVATEVAAGPRPVATGGQVFVARQPIFDRTRQVYGYELLFRDSGSAATCELPSEHASARVMTDALLAFGLETLTQGRLAFINVTRRLLLEGIPAALPPDRVVLELLEDIEADEEVLTAVRALRRAGYTIALDDFVLTSRTAALVPLADFLKVDWLADHDTAELRRLAAARGTGRPALIAEKIESQTHYDEANRDGYHYFQGYFFGRPITHEAREIQGHQAGFLRLLGSLSRPDLSVAELEALIKHDASLCYRVLRAVNSAGFGQHTGVQTIGQAVLLLGCETVRRWASLWVLAGLSGSANAELVMMSTVRARFCELLIERGEHKTGVADGFLLGMCSVLDAILNAPLEAVLKHLPLSEDIVSALRGEDTPGRRVLDCAIAYERADWDTSLKLAQRLGISHANLSGSYNDALRWAVHWTG